jgi:PAS domain-containing protein
VGQANPALDSLTPVASGVLAVRLSTRRPDYLMWFRKEQLHSVTWAGDPAKPMVASNPLELSPRSSFAAWSEIVRGTALPWSSTEQALARAVGVALVDIIVQVSAVRLLVAEHQLAGIRSAVQSSQEPVAITSDDGRLLFANPALAELLGCDLGAMTALDDLAQAFADPAALRAGLQTVRQQHRTWRGELTLARSERGSPGGPVPVGVRIELVPGRDGQVLGCIIVLANLSGSRRAQAARRHLEQALHQAGRGGRGADGLGGQRSDEVVSAILTNASLAAMDISDSNGHPGLAPLLEEVEASAQRATALYGRIRSLLDS